MSTTAGYAHPVLVETSWVAEHLNDPKVRIVEVDVDTSAYEQGHIPGAVGWNWKTQLQASPQRDVVSKEGFEALCRASGIANDTLVVFYGDNNNWFAAYAYWLARYYGHPRELLRLLNGGRAKWVAEKRPLTREVPSYPPTTYTAQAPDFTVRAFRDYVYLSVVNKAQVALVDVRSPREYSGELLAPENLPQEGSQRGGHIPGAINIPWSLAVREDGTFKSAEELRALYAGRGILPDKEVVTYCRIGERSAHTWFVLQELLGYPKVRNYDGSWTEWGSVVGAPIRTGPQP
ncbi:MAG: sulfurtransferase [Dehalococcoidia bacterium]|nr:sulfurtransferase [Dehalococcoidia bacterium]MDW8119545.1 sulfurtransferase [Chloroflexota bacterium]